MSAPAPPPPSRQRKYKNIIVMKVGQQYGSRVIPVEIATYLEDASRPVMYIEVAGKRFTPERPVSQIDPATAQSIATGIGSTPEQVMSDIMNSSQRFKTGGIVADSPEDAWDYDQVQKLRNTIFALRVAFSASLTIIGFLLIKALP